MTEILSVLKILSKSPTSASPQSSGLLGAVIVLLSLFQTPAGSSLPHEGSLGWEGPSAQVPPVPTGAPCSTGNSNPACLSSNEVPKPHFLLHLLAKGTSTSALPLLTWKQELSRHLESFRHDC